MSTYLSTRWRETAYLCRKLHNLHDSDHYLTFKATVVSSSAMSKGGSFSRIPRNVAPHFEPDVNIGEVRSNMRRVNIL